MISSRDIKLQVDILLKGADLLGRDKSAAEAELHTVLSHAHGRPLRVKAGFDPSAPDLHLGHAVLMKKLRQFQNLGHQVDLVVGDFTALIGDPTGRNVTRPALTMREVQANAKTYTEQAFKILKPDKTNIHYNSHWLGELKPQDFIKLCAQNSVSRMLERDDFKKRYKAGISIGVHEFLYPLLQAYDSVKLRSDIEMGGTDQVFNLLLGRDLQRAYKALPESGLPQMVLTMPLLEGVCGVHKMSKSHNNHIAFNDAPGEVFGKIMSLSDHQMIDYWKLIGDPEDPIKDIKQLTGPELRQHKAALGEFVVNMFHPGEGKNARQNFAKIFKEKSYKKSDIPQERRHIMYAGSYSSIDVLHKIGVRKSRSDVQRLIKSGGVRMQCITGYNEDDVIVFNDNDEHSPIIGCAPHEPYLYNAGHEYAVKVGKKNFDLVKVIEQKEVK